MTPTHVRSLIALAGTQRDLAEAVNAQDSLLRVTAHAISRYARGVRSPSPHVAAALTAVWLSAGYPCIADGRPATLTTSHAASSYGLPVVVIEGVPHGAAECESIDLSGAPPSIVAAAIHAGYRLWAPDVTG